MGCSEIQLPTGHSEAEVARAPEAQPQPRNLQPGPASAGHLLLSLGSELCARGTKLGVAHVRPAGRCPLCPVLSRGSGLCH